MTRAGGGYGIEPGKRKYSVKDAKRWREQRRKGMTYKQIAKKSKVSISTIFHWLSLEAIGELE